MAVVRNIQTNDLYLYLGDNQYKNLRTGVSGAVSDEMAQKIFKVNIEATLIFDEYPLVAELVNRLNMVLDK